MQNADFSPTAVGALAAFLAQGKTDEEIALLAAAFTFLGDGLLLILSARSCERGAPDQI